MWVVMYCQEIQIILCDVFDGGFDGCVDVEEFYVQKDVFVVFLFQFIG